MGRMRSKRWRVGVVAARTRAPSQWVRARAPVLYRLPSLGVSARGLFVAIVSSFSFHSPCCARIVFLRHRLRLCDAFSGAAAAAAGRGSPPPPGAACERRWVDIDLRHSRNETEREGAGPCPGTSPRPTGAPLEPARSKWGFGGDEKERFVCTTAPLFVFGVLMQAKRCFLPLQSWILPPLVFLFSLDPF